jgi:peptidoglycan/xylan/chitin deacetylase (PgdA/CDA1 family)
VVIIVKCRRLIAKTISEAIACFYCADNPPQGFRILMYHAVGTPALGDRLGIFSLTPERFRRQMALLSAWKQGSVVGLSEKALLGGGIRVAVTFDDGYLDNLEMAAPILIELGLPFTVFVTSEFVRKGIAGFLSPSALRELAKLPGVQIGAHGANHIPLSQCDDSNLHNELVTSKHYLEDILGSEVRTLAYPYGSANRRVKDYALAAGYRLGACSLAGINQAERDPMLLSRTEILSFDNERAFCQKLHGCWDWYRWRSQDPACL